MNPDGKKKEPPWVALRRPETARAEQMAAEDAFERGQYRLAEALYATATWQREGGELNWDIALAHTRAWERAERLEVPAPDDGVRIFGPITTVEPPCASTEAIAQ